ncbi:MAG: hypothetical protein ACEQSB_00125 [Undibacterium sp.]
MSYIADQIRLLASTFEDFDLYWIETPKGEHETNDGLDWCYDCARAEFDKLRQDDPENEDEYCLMGGYVQENDSPKSCAKCGRRLSISLTDCGVHGELAHYEERGVFSNHIAEQAYDLNDMFGASLVGSPEYGAVEAIAAKLLALPEAQAALESIRKEQKS